MTEEPDSGSHCARVGRKVAPEHDSLTGRQVSEPGAESEQGGLAGAVRTPDEHDLARRDVEVDSGERGEAPEQRDRRGEGGRRSP